MIKLEEINGTIKVFSPYNSDFIRDLKSLTKHSKWDGESWNVEKKYEETIENLLFQYFKYKKNNELINIKIEALENLYGEKDGIYFKGYPIAYASGRDSGAKISEAIMLSGVIDSCGSVKNWQTYIKKGSEFKLLNVPSYLAEYDENWDEWGVALMEEEKISLEEIIFEKIKEEIEKKDIDNFFEKNIDKISREFYIEDGIYELCTKGAKFKDLNEGLNWLKEDDQEEIKLNDYLLECETNKGLLPLIEQMYVSYLIEEVTQKCIKNNLMEE